jgi:hypothetical protein
MNKPLENIVALCQDESLTKAREALVKSYEQHQKALEDLRNAVKKSMTAAIVNEDFDALEDKKALLEKAKTYAEQLEALQEAKPAKKAKKAE